MTFDMRCPTTTQQVRSRRTDQRAWELRIHTQNLTPSTASAMPEAASAAGNPVFAQMVAKMEEQIRKNPDSADASALRQQIKALCSGAGVSPPGVTNSSTLICTKIADDCR
jgi:hypothetical protein